MAGTFLRLLVVLWFSHLICLNAIPITRTRSLEHRSQGYGLVSANDHMMLQSNAKKRWNMIRRMDVELNDYPGSGANNRHTPRSQLGRGCVDC